MNDTSHEVGDNDRTDQNGSGGKSRHKKSGGRGNGTGSKVRVLIVDDHPVVRDGLEAQLVLAPDMEVCGFADNIPDAMAAIERSRPEVAVVDISLKEGDGIDLVKRIGASYKSVRVVVWSMYRESLYAERALRAGAMGYVHKGTSTGEILRAIRSALAGTVYLSEGFTARLVGRLVAGGAAPGVDAAGHDEPRMCSLVESLSDRELEVFTFLGQGMATEKVAQGMCLSPKTVETYRARIKEKLGLENVTALVQQAALWVKESS